MECTQKDNTLRCTCTYPDCPRKGKCCECIAHHRNLGEVPGCLFPPEAEKTYDRSVEKFVECWK